MCFVSVQLCTCDSQEGPLEAMSTWRWCSCGCASTDTTVACGNLRRTFLMSEVPLSPPNQAGALQRCLAHKKQRPPKTLQYDYAEGPMAALRGGALVQLRVRLH